MEILIGLLIIAVGAFCQSSCYVPINRIKDWSWESYWIVQGVFAWLVFPFLGALLAVPEGHSLTDLFTAENSFDISTIFPHHNYLQKLSVKIKRNKYKQSVWEKRKGNRTFSPVLLPLYR